MWPYGWKCMILGGKWCIVLFCYFFFFIDGCSRSKRILQSSKKTEKKSMKIMKSKEKEADFFLLQTSAHCTSTDPGRSEEKCSYIFSAQWILLTHELGVKCAVQFSCRSSLQIWHQTIMGQGWIPGQDILFCFWLTSGFAFHVMPIKLFGLLTEAGVLAAFSKTLDIPSWIILMPRNPENSSGTDFQAFHLWVASRNAWPEICGLLGICSLTRISNNIT